MIEWGNYYLNGNEAVKLREFYYSDLILDLRINLESEELKTNSRFDLVLSSMAFHHLDNPAAMLKKLKPFLSEEGKFAVIDLDKEDGTFHADPSNMGVKHFGFSEADQRKWAQEAGLRLLNREIIYTIKKNGGSYPIFLAIFSE